LLYFNTDPEDSDFYDDLEFFGLAKPIEQAILSAIRCGKIDGFLRYTDDGAENSYTSTVQVESLKAWFTERGLKPQFFFPAGEKETPDYLNKNHSRYAPKLAAAVNAWLATSETKGKTPRQALEKWLRERAAEYGLSDDEGKQNNTGIEECAKVANWKPEGGAPKTPSSEPAHP